jgi:hypothetical protein
MDGLRRRSVLKAAKDMADCLVSFVLPQSQAGACAVNAASTISDKNIPVRPLAHGSGKKRVDSAMCRSIYSGPCVT